MNSVNCSSSWPTDPNDPNSEREETPIRSITRRCWMKCRTLIVLGLLSPALALAQPVDSTKAPAKPDTKQPAAKAADPLNDSMIAQEKKVWESIAKQDWTTFGAFLADDFTEITPTGFHNKSATLTSIKDGKLGKH